MLSKSQIAQLCAEKNQPIAIDCSQVAKPLTLQSKLFFRDRYHLESGILRQLSREFYHEKHLQQTNFYNQKSKSYTLN